MKKLFAIGVYMIGVQIQSRGQGCSDAGFCSVGVLQANSIDERTSNYDRNSIGFLTSIGEGENNTHIVIPQLEYVHYFNRTSFIEAKFPFYFATGNLGKTLGISDPIITYSNTFYRGKNFRYSATAGLKIGLGSTDKANENGNGLPMPYQPGLGTTDLILGIKADYKDLLSIAAGYQQPIIQYNHNRYLSTEIPSESFDYHNYFESKALKRRPDMLLRADVHYGVKKFRFSAGPLFIFHLGKDKFKDLNDKESEISGSNGLTLNATTSAQYSLNRHFTINIAAGIPLVARAARPDGLKRSWVVAPRLTYLF